MLCPSASCFVADFTRAYNNRGDVVGRCIPGSRRGRQEMES